MPALTTTAEIMKIITISQSKSMPGSWCVSGPGGGRGGLNSVDAYNAGDAAAKALVWAQRVGAPYAIVGHDDAMKLIPAEVRSRS